MSNNTPSKGPWMLDGTYITAIRDAGKPTIADCGKSPTLSRGEQIANAELFMDAGRVYHATGRTPSQLLAQRDQLLAALKALYTAHEGVTTAIRIVEKSENK